MLLSRHAEGLFWAGRYLERASYITRMLDVASVQQLERSTRSAAEVWRDLLRVLYLEDDFAATHGAEMTTATVTEFLVFDRENASSVAASVREARNNVMNVRDIVPIELLESVNRLHAELTGGALRRRAAHGPHEVYEILAASSRTVTGAIDEAMPRHDGYRFLVAGRLLERAEMTCRMIDVNRTIAGTDASAWITVLRSVSGFHGFMRIHGALAPPDAAVGFMLHEPSFPFGVLHCLSRVSSLLSEVDGAASWKSPRAAGRLAADLQYAEIPSVDDPSLERLLERLEANIRTTSENLHNDLYQFGGDPLMYSFETV